MRKKKNRVILSASEINRYIYCHYQWYYEKYYSKKKLATLYRERNRAYGEANSRESHFERGRRFHENYLEQNRERGIGGWILLAIAVIACLYLLLKVFVL